MTSFGPETYGESFADVYDQWYGRITDAGATAEFLTARHNGGPVLELGVGTGRLADPLIEHGLDVVGLDASPSMLARCPRTVHAVLADMAVLPFAEHAFGSALCAFNTLFNLPSAQSQQESLTQIARCLAPGAPLIVETITGHGLGHTDDSSLGVSRIEVDRLVLSATSVDANTQTITGQHVDITESGIRMRPWLLRWTTPTQLDELAEQSGLKLVERYGSWNESPFDPYGDLAISVYERAEGLLR